MPSHVSGPDTIEKTIGVVGTFTDGSITDTVHKYTALHNFTLHNMTSFEAEYRTCT